MLRIGSPKLIEFSNYEAKESTVQIELPNYEAIYRMPPMFKGPYLRSSCIEFHVMGFVRALCR